MSDRSDWVTHWLPDAECLLRVRGVLSSVDRRPFIVEFEAYEVVGFVGDGTLEGLEPHSVWMRNYRGSGDDIDIEAIDEDKAHRHVYGQVKWDGDAHVYFGEPGDQGYHYYGGREDASKTGLLLEHVYRVAWEFYLAAGNQWARDEFLGDERG